MGANRRHVEAKLPHLNRLLARRPEEALRGRRGRARLVHRRRCVTAALRDAAPPHVIDLPGRLGAEVEALAGYEGVGW